LVQQKNRAVDIGLKNLANRLDKLEAWHLCGEDVKSRERYIPNEKCRGETPPAFKFSHKSNYRKRVFPIQIP
jgi:hypothetical protein